RALLHRARRRAAQVLGTVRRLAVREADKVPPRRGGPGRRARGDLRGRCVGPVPAHPHRPRALSGRGVALARGAHARALGSARDDSPARLVICFHGDVSRLDVNERFTAQMYKSLTGSRLPYSMLMYVWANDAPVGTIAASGYTGKIQMIVVDGGGVGEWREFR